jgi:hypothetical protein
MYEYFFKNLKIQDMAVSFRKLAFNHFRIGYDMSPASLQARRFFAAR